jgi:hypothetical protein
MLSVRKLLILGAVSFVRRLGLLGSNTGHRKGTIKAPPLGNQLLDQCVISDTVQL